MILQRHRRAERHELALERRTCARQRLSPPGLHLSPRQHHRFNREDAGGPPAGMLTQMSGGPRRGWARNRGKFSAGRSPRRPPGRFVQLSADAREKSLAPLAAPASAGSRGAAARGAAGFPRRRRDAGRPPRPAPPLPHQGWGCGGGGAFPPAPRRLPAAGPRAPSSARWRGRRLPPASELRATPAGSGRRWDPGTPAPRYRRAAPPTVPYRLPERWSRSPPPWRHWRGATGLGTPRRGWARRGRTPSAGIPLRRRLAGAAPAARQPPAANAGQGRGGRGGAARPEPAAAEGRPGPPVRIPLPAVRRGCCPPPGRVRPSGVPARWCPAEHFPGGLATGSPPSPSDCSR